mgnify:CR=1 FL=1
MSFGDDRIEPRHRLSAVDWPSLVPRDIAAAQIRWERMNVALRMRRAGLTFREIGERQGGVSVARARQMVWKATHQEKRLSPVEGYLAMSWPGWKRGGYHLYDDNKLPPPPKPKRKPPQKYDAPPPPRPTWAELEERRRAVAQEARQERIQRMYEGIYTISQCRRDELAVVLAKLIFTAPQSDVLQRAIEKLRGNFDD